jgi:transcriptional regulator with XRE-family HTH domain
VSVANDGVVDELAIEQALEGNTDIPLTAKEMKVAWRRLDAQNLEASEIAETLGVTARTVFRWRQGMAPTARQGSPSRQLLARPAAASVAKAEPVTVATLEARIAEGMQSPVKSVARAAERARDAVQRFVEVEREERGKAALHAEVAELERKLREAKAKLRNKPTEAPPASVAEMRAWCVSQGIDVPAKVDTCHVRRSRPTRGPMHEA